MERNPFRSCLSYTIILFEIWHQNHIPAKPNVRAKIQTAVSKKEMGTIERKTAISILFVC